VGELDYGGEAGRSPLGADSRVPADLGRAFLTRWKTFVSLGLLTVLFLTAPAPASDHNDPNAVNSIFSNIDVSAADLYDMFAFPAPNAGQPDRIVLALTFAAVPKAGVLDSDMLYRILLAPEPRVVSPWKAGKSLESVLGYFDAVKDKYLNLKASEIRVKVNAEGKATIKFINFPGGDFTQEIATNTATALQSPGGHAIQAFVGGRDDPFFNDLTGFFRSINYAPQFYKIRDDAPPEMRELVTPKSLIELDGNTAFNFDPATPLHGYGLKKDVPPEGLTWSGSGYKKNASGNFVYMYSGKDAQAGKNANAVIVELPLAYLTKDPAGNRIVNAWGESLVLKASGKVKAIPDEGANGGGPFWLRHPWTLPLGLFALAAVFFLRSRKKTVEAAGTSKNSRLEFLLVLASGFLIVVGAALGIVATVLAGQNEIVQARFDPELGDYKLVDTDGQPFADAALNEREDKRQLGANNFFLGPHFIQRLAHLGWGFGPSITALGLKTSFDHGDTKVSIHKTYDLAAEAFPKVAKTLFQELNMPDDRWNPKGLPISLKRPVEIFVPNVIAVDMDTTGTWPYGHRLDDQVATRFLSLFLDMTADFKGKKYHIEILNDPEVLAALPLEPKVPPNPLKNDKEFLPQFPWLADPWPQKY